jgi:hypothetical protein
MMESIHVPNYNLALKDARHELGRFMADPQVLVDAHGVATR